MTAGQVGKSSAESVDGLSLAGIYLAVVDRDAVSQAEGTVRHVACGNGTVLRDRHLSPQWLPQASPPCARPPLPNLGSSVHGPTLCAICHSLLLMMAPGSR